MACTLWALNGSPRSLTWPASPNVSLSEAETLIDKGPRQPRSLRFASRPPPSVAPSSPSLAGTKAFVRHQSHGRYHGGAGHDGQVISAREHPGDLWLRTRSVLGPTKYEPVINSKTAKALSSPTQRLPAPNRDD